MPVALMADQLGPPDKYRLVDYDPGPPGPREVRIRITSAGVSFADALIASGRYQVRPDVPFIPGTEAAGIVEAVGEEVLDVAPGQPVAARAFGGLFAQYANLPSRSVRPLPADLDLEEASVLSLSYATAWHALSDRANLRPQQTLLVLGAAGATGYAAVQVGKFVGARVIASASSPEKRALALAGGADAVLDSTSESWRDCLRTANDGNPVDVVFDPLGGAMTEQAFRALGWGGRHLVVGFVLGRTELRTNLALIKGASLVGCDVRQFEARNPGEFAANLSQIFDLAAQEVFRPPISRRYRLDQFKAAMSDASSGKLAGRIVITP